MKIRIRLFLIWIQRQLGILDTHTCPRRSEPGQFGHGIENEDYWYRRKKDRTCSYCGSMHPEDFNQVLLRVITDPACTIDISDKPYKIYINRPEVHNSDDGALKYYTQHGIVFWENEVIGGVDRRIHAAVTVSNERFKKILEKRHN